MAVCNRCANIDLDDVAVQYTYLLGHVRVMIATAKAGCPGCNFIIEAADRRGIEIGAKRSFYVILRRLGKRSHRVDVHFVRLEGEEDEDDSDEREEESSEGTDEGSSDEDGQGSDDNDEESAGDNDEDSEDSKDVSPIQLKLCSAYGMHPSIFSYSDTAGAISIQWFG